MPREPDPFEYLDRQADEPDEPEEEQTCSYCGEPCEGRWCSSDCRRADESDRG